MENFSIKYLVFLYIITNWGGGFTTPNKQDHQKN
jgi:hypothetical protein